MKKILLVLIFIWMGGLLPARAFDLDENTGFCTFGPYPYPPALSPAIDNLPEGFNTIILGTETFYYFNGTFFQKIVRDAKYAVVSPPIGAVVFNLPEGHQYMLIDGRAFYVVGGVYYKKVLNGYKVILPPPGIY